MVVYDVLGFLSSPNQTTMENLLTTDEILKLVNTGMVELSDDLILRMQPKSESYEDSDWYNDPNCVMSKHHY